MIKRNDVIGVILLVALMATIVFSHKNDKRFNEKRSFEERIIEINNSLTLGQMHDCSDNSCLSFLTRAVEQEKIDRIMEAGLIAPMAVNKLPVHVWAVTAPETLEAVKGVTRSNYGAPLILVVGCRPADAWVRRYDGKNGAEVDASIVATYLMLAAENEGLATLWVGSFDPALLKGILPGTEGYELVAMINVGYPSDDSAPSAMHGSRVAVEEFVTKMGITVPVE